MVTNLVIFPMQKYGIIMNIPNDIYFFLLFIEIGYSYSWLSPSTYSSNRMCSPSQTT